MRGPKPPLITLTSRQRALLEQLVRQATCAQRTVKRAHIWVPCTLVRKYTLRDFRLISSLV